jgi:hypothetical protein
MSDDADQIALGRTADNVGILEFSQRPLPVSPQSAEVFVKLGNFSSAAREVEIELSLDGRAFDLRRLSIEPGSDLSFSAVVSQEMLAAGNGFLLARLTTPDELNFDNVAYAALPVGERVRVLLIGHDDPFLEMALKADPSIAVEILRPEMWRSDMGAGFDAVVFDNWLPPEATLESLGRGSFFFFGRTPFDIAGEEIRTVSLETAEPESPLLWNVEMGATRLSRAGRIAVPGGEQWRVSIPVESADDPMVVALEGSRGVRVVAAAFAVGDSNFPLRVGFPLFVSNVIHWLAGRDTTEKEQWKAGKTFIPAKDEKISQQPVRQTNEAKNKSLPATDAPLKLTKNGFYEVRGPAQSRWLAINTGDRAESDLRAAESTDRLSFLTRSWGVLQAWRWLAIAAAVLLVAEWFLHHRRLTE